MSSPRCGTLPCVRISKAISPPPRPGMTRSSPREPDFAPALHLLGVVARAQGERDRARDAFAAAVAAAPEFVEARIEGAELALERARRRARALRRCAKASSARLAISRSCACSVMRISRCAMAPRRRRHSGTCSFMRPPTATRISITASRCKCKVTRRAPRVRISGRSRSSPISSPPISISACCSSSRPIRTAAIAAYSQRAGRRPEARRRLQEPGRGAARRWSDRRLARQLPRLREALSEGAAARGVRARGLPAPGRFCEPRALSRWPAAARNSRPATRRNWSIASRSCSTCCCSSMSSPRLLLRLRARVRRGRGACLRHADAEAGRAQAGAAAHRLPVRRSAQPRDGQDDVAGDRPSRPRATSSCYFYSKSSERDEWTRALRGVGQALHGGRGARRCASGGAHRRRRSRHPRRPVDAHARRAAGHPRAQAGARADHARRERGHRRACPPSTSSSPTATPTCRRTRSSRSSACWRWTAACFHSGTSRRRAGIHSIARRWASPPMRSSSARSSIRSSCRGDASRLWRDVLAADPARGARVLARQSGAARQLPAAGAGSRHCARALAIPAAGPRRRGEPGALPASSISCSTRCRTAASTARSKRSTWACRWSRSSASAMANARRIRSCATLASPPRSPTPAVTTSKSPCRLADDRGVSCRRAHRDSRRTRRSRRWSTWPPTPATSKRRTARRSAGARPTYWRAPDHHGRSAPRDRRKRALPQATRAARRVLADAMLADSGLAMPDRFAALVLRSRAHEALGDLPNAIVDLDGALALDATQARVWNELGLVCADAGHERTRRRGVRACDAIRSRLRARVEQPGQCAAGRGPRRRGGARGRTGGRRRSRLRAGVVEPGRAEARRRRRRRCRDRAAARAEPRSEPARRPGHARRTAARAKRPAGSGELFARAAELDRRDANAALLLGGTLAERDDLAGARAAYAQARRAIRGCCARCSAAA